MSRRFRLYVGQEHVADLLLAIYLTLDRSGEHLKTARSDFRVFSTLDRTPLLRMEYRGDMRVDPVCHWQVHAERGAFTQVWVIYPIGSRPCKEGERDGVFASSAPLFATSKRKRRTFLPWKGGRSPPRRTRRLRI